MRNITLTFVFLFTALSSCVTNRKLTYLQHESTLPIENTGITPSDYRILPFDNLFIRVITPEPNMSTMFNKLPVESYNVSVTEQSADLISYPVDINGEVDLPYIGKILVAGKSLNEITAEIEKRLGDYIADPSVSVRMVNNYVSLLGEVNRPGKYPIYKERLTIFQALAMAGDLGDFSNRQKIQIIRPKMNGNVIMEFSLNDISIMTSEFYHVMPNDVIYAKPIKGRIFQMNAFPYSLILSTITTFVLILNVIQ